MQRIEQITSLLEQLEQELRNLDYWQNDAPEEQALASTAPFAADTLAFHEWLQWLFIPKMQFLIMNQQVPVMKSEIAAMAEVWIGLQGAINARRLLEIIQAIDQALCNQLH